ncbi:MAG: YbaB/EbfC family nucleoid-associated protein [Myxococcales bacterium]|nr:YbaB/EbfC family nucleoid-associated protein [Myxococcales bacterium]
MSDLFGGGNPLGGGMAGMMGGFQQRMADLQAEAQQVEVDGIAANGLVRVRMNGAQEVLAVHIDPKAAADVELLEDLVRAATNDAIRRAKEVVAEKLLGLAAGMGLPPGLFGG